MKNKIDLAEIARKLSNAATMCKDANEDLNTASWQYENGVLISANEAKAIASALEALPKLVDALTDIMSIEREPFFEQDFKAIKKAKSILSQFETTK